MPIRTLKAIILKKSDFRDTSLLITCYTDTLGKIKGVIKGVKGFPFKYGSPFEPVSLNAIVFYERAKSEIGLVSKADLIDDYGGLRRDLSRMAFGAYFVELVDKFSMYGDPSYDIFVLLDNVLSVLKDTDDYLILTHLFEASLLRLLGIMPDFHRCGGCSKDVFRPVKFDAARGNVFCSECAGKYQKGVLIDDVILSYTKAVSDIDFSDRQVLADGVKRIKYELGVNRQAVKMIRRYVDFHVDTPLKSVPVLKQIYKEEKEFERTESN